MTVVNEINEQAAKTAELVEMMNKQAIMYETINSLEPVIEKIAKEYVELGTQNGEYVDSIMELFETATDEIMVKYESKLRLIKEDVLNH